MIWYHRRNVDCISTSILVAVASSIEILSMFSKFSLQALRLLLTLLSLPAPEIFRFWSFIIFIEKTILGNAAWLKRIRYLKLDKLLLKVSPLGSYRYFSNQRNLKVELRNMQNGLHWIEMALPLCNFRRHSCWSNPCKYKNSLKWKSTL